jgi:hypothetical protein
MLWVMGGILNGMPGISISILICHLPGFCGWSAALAGDTAAMAMTAASAYGTYLRIRVLPPG